MRRLRVALMVCGMAALAVPLYAVPCGTPIFMQHQVSNFVCKDATEVAALAWQINNAANNSGTENIACEAAGRDNCLQGGTAGDGVVVIDFDWVNPGIAGCPQIAGVNNRVVVVVQADDGRGVMASIGGTSVDLTAGYIVDLAHPGGLGGDPTAPQLVRCGNVCSNDLTTPCASNADCPAPATCKGAGRPTINLATNNTDGTTTLNLTFPQPQVFSDCDPNSVGQAFGFCGDGFSPAAGQGNIYTSIQHCNSTCSNAPTTMCTSNADCPAGGSCLVPSRPGVNRANWTLNAVRPDATGNAVITVPRPTSSGDCLYVGSTTMINGNESAGITGFAAVGGPGVASPVALDVRAEQAGGNVRIRWHTSIEVGLVGFNVLTDGGKQGLRKVNDALIVADGNGGGKPYEVSIARGKFQSSRTVIIESVLADQTTLRSAPAKF